MSSCSIDQYSETVQYYSTVPLEIQSFFLHPDHVQITNPFLAMYKLMYTIILYLKNPSDMESIGAFCIQWKQGDIRIRATVLKPIDYNNINNINNHSKYVMEFEKLEGGDEAYREIVNYFMLMLLI